MAFPASPTDGLQHNEGGTNFAYNLAAKAWVKQAVSITPLTQAQIEGGTDTNEGTVSGTLINQAFTSKLVDNLTSTDNTKALTAAQGKVLKDIVDGIGERKQVADNAAMAADTTSPDGTTFFVTDDGGTGQWAMYQRIAGADNRVLGQSDLAGAIVGLTAVQLLTPTDTGLGLVSSQDITNKIRNEGKDGLLDTFTGILAGQGNVQNAFNFLDTYTQPVMVGATAGAVGVAGTVPAGAAGDQDKLLTAGGVFVDQYSIPLAAALPDPATGEAFRLAGHATLPDSFYWSTGTAWVEAR